MRWLCGNFELDLDAGPLLMGILNVTPDSFSDGYPTPEVALNQAAKLADSGAHIIDVGGESTRPGSLSVTADEETARVIPVIQALRERVDLPISIDTQKPEVARAALAAGADIVNHVSGTLDFEAMLPVLVESKAGYVAMHMQDRPKTMQRNPEYTDVTAEVADALTTVRDAVVAAGVSPERLLFDPGIGFGKTLDHNLQLMRTLENLAQSLERPLLMGVSRKSWLNHLLEPPPENLAVRDAMTTVASVLMPHPAVAVHRIHNPGLVRDGFKVASAAFGGAGGNFFNKK